MEITVSPDMQFYNLLESYPYNPTSALCEYIDNALQAFIDAKKNGCVKAKKIKIELLFNDTPQMSSITIRDHGVGIDIENIQNALKPAFTPKNHSLSEFGIGMKAASIWFGRKWELKSFPAGSKKGFFITFDLDELLLKNSDKILVNTFERDIKTTGVEITLSRLKRGISKRAVDDIWRDLQEIYQIFIFRNDAILDLSIKFNGTKLLTNDALNKYEPDILNYPTVKIYNSKPYSYGKEKSWRVTVDFEFNKQKVTGFICALKKSSQKDNPGIRLFRYNRLIRGSQHQPYRPIDLVGTPNKHAPSRVYGELHLDGQPISNHKGDFLFDETFFLEILKAEVGIDELINQAENYRALAAKDGDVQHFKTEEEYQSSIENQEKAPIPRNPTPKTKENNANVKKNKAQHNSPIDILDDITIPSNILLLQDIIDETKELYENRKWWPFCLSYRVVLEVGIFQKLKSINIEEYKKCSEKGIVGLVKHLSANLQLIDTRHASLIRSLKGNVLENIPQIDMLNTASHGHYHPFQADSELLIKNTQSLLEWIFEDKS
ncbi:MAG: ATP-binding protein [Pseudomonadota bacterium]